jgi:hypothetical protein
MLPDATVLTARSAAKLVNMERGARGVMARLVALGSPPPQLGQAPREWLDVALAAVGATRVRHPGNHRYLIRLGSRRQRRRTCINLAPCRYPKQDQPSQAIRVALDAAAPTLFGAIR